MKEIIKKIYECIDYCEKEDCIEGISEEDYSEINIIIDTMLNEW